MTAASGLNEATAEPAGEATNRNPLIRIVGLAVVLLALATATVSFLVLTGETRVEPTPDVIRIAGIVNGVVVCMMVAILAYEAWGLIEARRRRRAGSRLHVRIVALFSIVAALPAILTAAIASITLDKGLDRWFSERTVAIIETSRTVAQAYVEEHSRVLALEMLAMAAEFNRVAPDIERNQESIKAYLSNQGRLRGLSAISLIRRDRTTIVKGETNTNLQVPPPPPDIFDQVEDGQPALIAPGRTNLVGGVLKLTSFQDVYLYLARPIDPTVTRYVRLTDENADEYQQLEQSRFRVQVAFAIVFTGMALVVLLSAIWIGLGFADHLVAPIRYLIAGAGKVSAGNLDVQVPVHRSAGDIGSLGETFNTMTAQLKTQRDELLNTNRELDERRQFTEAVLSGVSSGVIGLDHEDRVTLVNAAVPVLIGVEADELVGRPLIDFVPEIQSVLAEAGERGRPESRGQINITREAEQRTLNVRVTRESSSLPRRGLVVTLDDITDLVAAQRRSAWADVARRIAHEIKNPLTPIQLSAERLRRRYAPMIAEDDRSVFDQCTETIVRQVGDIRRMVDEFSSFARMPKPVMERRDVSDVVKEAVFLQEVGNPEFSFRMNLPAEPVTAPVDHRLVAQAMTNIVKNAAEAIEAVSTGERTPGEIVVSVRDAGDHAAIEVEDNGKGLPEVDRESLLEPYMTTREKGTGLGLAIVRKIMEEHGGTIALLDRSDSGRGARVVLMFPKHDPDLVEPQPSEQQGKAAGVPDRETV